jgi:NADH:ubiquinone oxidoreductase subunit F (NADH-binding)/ferredoxin
MANMKFVQPGAGPLARERAWPSQIVIAVTFVLALAGAGAASRTGPGLAAASATFWFLEFYSGVLSLVALSLTVMGGLLSTDRIVLLVRHRVLRTPCTGPGQHRDGLPRGAPAHQGGRVARPPSTWWCRSASHRTVYVGLGTIAGYMMVIVAWTGVVRARFASSARPWVWRVLHSLAYASWPIALIHGLKAGREAKTWVTVSYVICVLLVIVALTVRLAAMWGRRMRSPKAQTTGAIRPVGRTGSRSGGQAGARRPSRARQSNPTFEGPSLATASAAGYDSAAGDDSAAYRRGERAPAYGASDPRPQASPSERVQDFVEGYGLSVPDTRGGTHPRGATVPRGTAQRPTPAPGPRPPMPAAPQFPARGQQPPAGWSRKPRFSDDPRPSGVERRPAAAWTTADYWGTEADGRTSAPSGTPQRDEPALIDLPQRMRAARSGRRTTPSGTTCAVVRCGDEPGAQGPTVERSAAPPHRGSTRLRLDYGTHHDVHGTVRPLSSEELLGLAERIDLRGRGGAGFPFARKMRAVLDSAARRASDTIVVVNATEGEPASWKDKVLLTRAPHLILDGAALAARALGAQGIVIGVADDGFGRGSLMQALAERRMPTATSVVTVPHRFISGEGGALVRGINGEIPIPPGRKVRASDSGVAGLPTLLSNAETYSQLAVAARLGPSEYAAVGTRKEPGTVMLTIGGTPGRFTVVETPTGVPLKEILRICGIQPGQGVLVGGFHGKWITGEAAARAEVSRESLTEVGGTLGAGIIIPLGEDTCALGEVTRVVRYLAGQSAGQCGPCRMGLPDVARAMASLTDGSGGTGAINTVRTAASAVKGRGACSHPDGTARFAISALDTFSEDIEAHVLRDGCGRRVRGVLPLPAEETTGKRLVVDWTRCDGHGLCAHVVPELIRLDDNGFPSFPDMPVPAWLEPGARKAVSMCPALALRLGDDGKKRRRKNRH